MKHLYIFNYKVYKIKGKSGKLRLYIVGYAEYETEASIHTMEKWREIKKEVTEGALKSLNFKASECVFTIDGIDKIY